MSKNNILLSKNKNLMSNLSDHISTVKERA